MSIWARWTVTEWLTHPGGRAPRFGLPEPDSEIVHTFYPLLAGSIMEAQMRSDDEGDTGSGALASHRSHITMPSAARTQLSMLPSC